MASSGNADIELKIGMDDTLYRRQLEKLRQDTKDAISITKPGTINLDNTKNPLADFGGSKYYYGAVKDSWENFANPVAHKRGVVGPDGDILRMGGNYEMSGALMAGMQADLMGLSGNRYRNTVEGKWRREQAVLASSTWFMMDNPFEREAMLRVTGNGVAANMVNTDIGKIIETNYQMMKAGWAQDFVFDKDGSGGKIKGAPDFQSMREYAVATGLGRWTDKKLHDAEHFELINNELEKTEKHADKVSGLFKGWGDELKGALGTLGGIAGTLARTGLKALGAATAAVTAYDLRAYNVIGKAASNMPNDRSFLGMDTYDVIRTRMASNRLGIGEDTIYEGVKNLGTMSGGFKALGEGINVIPAALLGTLDNIMEASSNPLEAYIGIAQEIVNRTKEGSEERTTLLKLIEGQHILGISDIVGALSDPNRTMPGIQAVMDLFAQSTSPYLGAYGRAEEIKTEMVDTDSRIKAANLEMYESWMTAFGMPFRDWWAGSLETIIVPAFDHVMEVVAEKTPTWLGWVSKKIKDAKDPVVQGTFNGASYSEWDYYSGLQVINKLGKKLDYSEAYRYNVLTTYNDSNYNPKNTYIDSKINPYIYGKTVHVSDKNVEDATSFIIDILGDNGKNKNYVDLFKDDFSSVVGGGKIFNRIDSAKNSKRFWGAVSSLWEDEDTAKTLNSWDMSNSDKFEARMFLKDKVDWIHNLTDTFTFIPAMLQDSSHPYTAKAIENTIASLLGANTEAEVADYQAKLLSVVAAILDKIDIGEDRSKLDIYIQQNADGTYTVNGKDGNILGVVNNLSK